MYDQKINMPNNSARTVLRNIHNAVLAKIYCSNCQYQIEISWRWS